MRPVVYTDAMKDSFPSLLDLGPDFYDPVAPARFPEAHLRFANEAALRSVGLEGLSSEELKSRFWAFERKPEHLPTPLALRYHGHQFLSYNPDLGDGRGFTFAQFDRDGVLHEFGTKGSGQTPWSRSGDGRLTLKGAVREALCTEMLETLGVDTSKTVCIFETGESLERHDEPSPTRAAVLTRLSRGHVRIGSFQRPAAEGKPQNILKLRDYALAAFFRGEGLGAKDATEVFFRRVTERCADLCASYMASGFVHGVLNTDNINITGESFDYGPYRFLPIYDPGFTAAYFDRDGLYAFGRQPVTFLWNLDQLARCLQMAEPAFEPQTSLDSFGPLFNAAMQRHVLRRLNLKSRGPAEDADLVVVLFSFLEDTRLPFEQVWFDLHSGAEPDRLQRSPLAKNYDSEEFRRLTAVLSEFSVAAEERRAHPARSTSHACTLLIDEIESLWKPIAQDDDWTMFEKKIAEIRAARGLWGSA